MSRILLAFIAGFVLVAALFGARAVYAQAVTTAPVAKNATAVVQRDANLREGPGTTYKKVGLAKAGTGIKIIGTTQKGDWLQLDTKAWISASLVKLAGNTTPGPTPTSTATPKPTAIPRATATPAAKPTISAEERAYVNKLQLHIADLSQALIEIGELTQNPRIGQDDWTLAVALQMAMMISVDDAVNEMTPPSRLVGYHVGLTEMTGLCRSAADNLGIGLDNFDADALHLAAAQMAACGEKAGPLTEELETILLGQVSSQVTPAPTQGNTSLVDTDGDEIAFGEPVLFDLGGFTSIGVLVSNDSELVKTFTVKATYKTGNKIVAVAVGAVNDLLPGQVRAAILTTLDQIPAQYDTVRVDVDTMIAEEVTSPGAEAAALLEFGVPSVSNNGIGSVSVEVTNNDSTAHTFTVQATMMNGGVLTGYATGAVNDLAPGQTKTATLFIQGESSGDITLAAETVIQ